MVPPRFLCSLALFLCLLSAAPNLPAARLDPSSHVFIILMENHNWSSILGSSSAPYINNTLLPIASYTDQFYNPPSIHPSLPNYLWLEAGTNFGILNDNSPSSNAQSTTAHLATQLKTAGISWKTYQEGITGTTCPTTDNTANKYYVKHNPFAYFTDVTSSSSPACTSVMRPFTELATDLSSNTVAHYNFITPNICNDMHDTCAPTSNSVKQGDDWLATNVPAILSSAAYQNNGLLIITWDEAASGDGPIGMIVLSPLAKGGGYHNAIHYTHSSTLRTFQKIFGLTPLLGGAATALDLSDLFVLNAIPNADSQIPISSVTRATNAATVNWQSQSGLAYQVQWKANLTDATWMSITPTITGTGGILSWTDNGTQTGSVPSDHRYYRVTIP
jgi:phospholipase C